MISLRGKLLTAAPTQLDPNFFKAVVLVVQHNDRGAYGLILNYPTSRPGRLEWRGSQGRCSRRAKLFWGGPVTGPLMAVHTNGALAEREILPGIYFSAKRKKVVKLLSDPTLPSKFFVGYAGWGPQQLDCAVERGIWRVVPAAPEQIFSDGSGLWERLSRQASRLRLQLIFHVKHVPASPLLN